MNAGAVGHAETDTGRAVGEQPLQFEPADWQVRGAQVGRSRSWEGRCWGANFSLVLMTQTPGPAIGVSPWRAGTIRRLAVVGDDLSRVAEAQSEPSVCRPQLRQEFAGEAIQADAGGGQTRAAAPERLMRPVDWGSVQGFAAFRRRSRARQRHTTYRGPLCRVCGSLTAAMLSCTGTVWGAARTATPPTSPEPFARQSRRPALNPRLTS